MQKNNDNPNPWDECPHGLISQAATCRLEPPLRRMQRRRMYGFFACMFAAGIVMLISYSLAQPTPAQQRSSGTVNCRIVADKLRLFCNNKLQDASLERAIGKHINRCVSCRQMYQSTCGCEKQCPDRPRNVTVKPCFVSSKR
jgi:hypothetical protein